LPLAGSVVVDDHFNILQITTNRSIWSVSSKRGRSFVSTSMQPNDFESFDGNLSESAHWT